MMLAVMSVAKSPVSPLPGRLLRLAVSIQHPTPYIRRILVFPQTLIDNLAKQVIIRPSQVLDFGYKLRPNPMHAAQHQR
jgi:hypothetical protein